VRRGLVVVAMLLAAWIGWAAFGSPEEVTAWMRVARTDLVLGVEVTGTLEAVDSSLVGPPQVPNIYDFKIAWIAPEGVPVNAGDEVLAFDTSELEQRLRSEETRVASARKEIEKKQIDMSIQQEGDTLSLAEARSKLRKAELKAEHPPELVTGIEARKAELDLELDRLELESLEHQITATRAAAEAALAGLRSDLKRAEQAADRIRRSIEQMKILAPRDGIVIAVSDWQSQKKKVGESCWYGDKVLEIPDLDRMRAEGEVREGQIGSVAPGQPVTLHLDAHPDIEYHGTVDAVQRAVQSRSWRSEVKVVHLRIALAETDPERMRPGMRFRGLIETDRRKGVLVVPSSAIELTPDGPVVHRRTLLGPSPALVELGAHGQGRVEVVNGLEQGDWIAAERPPDEDPT